MTQEKKTSRSGTSQTYAEKMASKTPPCTLRLPRESLDEIERLSTQLRITKSLVVSMSVAEFAKKNPP